MAHHLKSRAKPDIVIRSQVVREDLPLPLVYYPNHYGTFFAFAEDEDAEPILCSCCTPAIANLVRLVAAEGSVYGDPLKMAPLSSRYFPDQLASESLGHSRALEAIQFVSDLCHRCNGSRPTLRYCHEMYGTEFTQYYGWYLNQAYLRSGILPLSLILLRDAVPPEFAGLMGRSTDLPNRVKNIARIEFGFPCVGEGLVSETLLFHVVERLLPGEEILRHHRPEWLGGLELDIYVPGRRLAVEYQGVQHFQPVAFWGGEESYLRQKERDRRKAHLCRSETVSLVCFAYTEPITEEYVATRLPISVRT